MASRIFAFLQTGQQEFEHHVVGEEDLGRVLLHLRAWSAFFLAGVLATVIGKVWPVASPSSFCRC